MSYVLNDVKRGFVKYLKYIDRCNATLHYKLEDNNDAVVCARSMNEICKKKRLLFLRILPFIRNSESTFFFRFDQGISNIFYTIQYALVWILYENLLKSDTIQRDRTETKKKNKKIKGKKSETCDRSVCLDNVPVTVTK